MPDREDISEHASDRPAPAAPLAPGIILSRRYGIVRPLHRGETGFVYLAVDRMLRRDVAIKELAVDPEQRERTIRRFKRYASRLSRLNHPSIPAVYDSFFAEQYGRFYVVMEYVRGTNLVALIHDTREGQLHETKVTELAMQVADALDYLHTRPVRIVHRNLNPAKLVLTKSGNVMLMHWFGRWVNQDIPWEAFRQTRCYAASEVFGGQVNSRSDVYSLGATMFFLLTGVDPKESVSDPELLHLPRMSTGMERILRQALAERPADRLSAAGLRSALAHLRLVQSIPVERPEGRVHRYEPEKPLIDENVQFTVYRPHKIKPLKWYPLLAYAHLTESRDDEDGVDPIVRVQEEAERIMRDQNVNDYRKASEDSLVAIPRQGEISFVPFIPGVDFNPSRASFFWEESVHRADFRVRASATLEGKTARGRMSVFLGAILLAEINLSVQVTSSSHEVQAQREQSVRPYRRIFPSYSHKDREIVAQLEHYVQIIGDRYMRDVFELRSGQNWKNWMAETIEGADIFQLFWSTNSMRSENVRLEWEHALRLKREHFIRPTYWETPLPESPSENLPPPELRDLHFQHVRPPAYLNPPAYLSDRLLPDFDEEIFVEYSRSKRDQVEAPAREESQARARKEDEALRREEENQPRRMMVLIVVVLGLLLLLLVGFLIWRN